MTPQPSPPQAAPTLSQDDRLLATCAHLSFLTGFWLMAPIAIYVIKRKESRFVAFHALQAAVVHLLFGATCAAGVFAFMLLALAVGLSGQKALSPLLAVVPVLGMIALPTGFVAVHAFAAYAAWQGRTWPIPLAGRIARAILGADEGAAKA